MGLDFSRALLHAAGILTTAPLRIVVTTPFLSVIVPAYNEEGCIDSTIRDVTAELERLAVSWELLIVDDGSADGTAAIVRQRAEQDPRVRLIVRPHRGKGAAVRTGMLTATGQWRFLADADLSMPIREIGRFLPSAVESVDDVVIGSRETAGSERLDEPAVRHWLGRLFNWAAKALVLGGIEDTQCGFKLFRGEAAAVLFGRQQLDGFGFDVEILFLARRAGLSIREVPVTWTYRPSSKVTAWSGGIGFLDLLRIRWHQLCGRYPRQATAARRARAHAASSK